MTLTKAGRYQIVGELGHGAMGIVYRGYDPTIGRTVAIKTVLLDTGDPETLKRFKREAQAAGVLSHPNIVTIYDAGEDDGIFYIAMELVEGETLQQILARGPLPLEQSIQLVEQVGAALDHAHARNIIHRDIKPANIMVSGEVTKVMDFGVAKITGVGLTNTGQVLGTPSYMSPELVKGVNVDGRSDMFSLGVVLYETMTGQKPFTGENITTVIYKIIGEDPEPPAAVNASLPAGVNYVVMKALAKKPEERYANCAEMVADLKDYRALLEKGKLVAKAAAAGVGASRQTSGTVVLSRAELGVREGTRSVPAAAGSNGRKRVLALAGVSVLALGLLMAWRVSSPDTSAPAEPERVMLPAAESARNKPSAFGAADQPTSRAQTLQAATLPPRPITAAPAAAKSLPKPTVPTIPEGRLSLHTDPKGARVLIDGKPTNYLTPVNIGVPPGKRKITFEKAGYERITREVVVQRDQQARIDAGLPAEKSRKRRLFFR